MKSSRLFERFPQKSPDCNSSKDNLYG